MKKVGVQKHYLSEPSVAHPTIQHKRLRREDSCESQASLQYRVRHLTSNASGWAVTTWAWASLLQHSPLRLHGAAGKGGLLS